MKPCRVAIAGGKLLAVEVLTTLAMETSYRVVGILPRRGDDADDPALPSLSRLARELGVPVLGEGERAPSVAEVTALHPDIIISIFYDRIFRKDMIAVPQIGILNLHFGLLPEYRGNRPIPWAMINGDPLGITIHYVDEGIDTGDVIRRAEVTVLDDDTAESVYRRATERGLSLLLRVLAEIIVEKAPCCPQDPRRAWYYRKGEPYDRWIDWRQPASLLARFIRALWFPPFPAARTCFGDVECEVYPTVRIVPSKGEPGRVLAVTDKLLVTTGTDAIEVATVRNGGNVGPAGEWARAIGVRPGDSLDGPVWRPEEWRRRDGGASFAQRASEAPMGHEMNPK